MGDATRFLTFIVRMTWVPGRGATGTVTRVRSGEQCRFDGVDAVSPLIATMLNDWLKSRSKDGAATRHPRHHE